MAGSHGDQVGQSFECGAAVGAPLDRVFQTAAERHMQCPLSYIEYTSRGRVREGVTFRRSGCWGAQQFGWALPRYLPAALQLNPGRALVDENVKACTRVTLIACTIPMNPGPGDLYWKGAYSYTPTDADRPTVVEALKAISCYEYRAASMTAGSGRRCASSVIPSAVS